MNEIFLLTLALATVAAIVGPIGEPHRRALRANALRPSDGELKPHCPGRVVAAAQR